MHRGSINVNTYKSSFFYFAHSDRTNIKLVFCYLCLGLRLTHQDLWEIEKIASWFSVISLNYYYFFLKCSSGHVSVSLMCSSVHQLSFCLLSFFMFFEKSLHCSSSHFSLIFAKEIFHSVTLPLRMLTNNLPLLRTLDP